jgi:hypothetical protein
MKKTDRGKTYLRAASSSYAPLCEYREPDKSGLVLYTLKSHTGKFIVYNKAFKGEIIKARGAYPDLALAADTFQFAFMASELPARDQARSDVQSGVTRWEDLSLASWHPRKSPPVPVQFTKKADNWKWSWERGWSYNHRRYLEWYARHGNSNFESMTKTVTANEKSKHTSKHFEKKQNLPKPLYDSGWLLYDPGEYKVLQHNVKIPPEKMIVIATSMSSEGDASCNTSKDHSIKECWSELTSTNIRVQRHYKDNTIEAIRIRIWEHE